MKKRHLLNFFLILIVLLLTLNVLRGIDFTEVLRLLKNIKVQYFFLAIASLFISYLIIVFRWQNSLRFVKKVPIRKLLILHWAGMFVNTITPGAQTGGEPVRAYFLGKMYKKSKTKFLGAILADKTFNFIIIISILVFSLLALSFFSNIPTQIKIFLQIVISMIIIIIIILVFIYLKEYHLTFQEYLVKTLHRRFLKRRFKKVSDFREYIEKRKNFFFKEYKKPFRNKKRVVFSIFLSLLSWLFVYFASYLIFLSFGIQINYVYILIVYSISEAVGALSPFPGGVGIMEASLILLYSLFSIPVSVALSVTILARFLHYFYALLVGGICLSYLRSKY